MAGSSGGNVFDRNPKNRSRIEPPDAAAVSAGASSALGSLTLATRPGCVALTAANTFGTSLPMITWNCAPLSLIACTAPTARTAASSTRDRSTRANRSRVTQW
ncbi:hypothetical protein EBM89_16360 [Cellulomonas triticagri]|uniref:Uncharacterized protein n=1 Tax=Cellulomonas triticagri TaxID=2483352 RepID=A0A3M2J3L1_9CELL|nr:hypothetical protein EBM89_16360 [Cellulomonas triticagri]